MFFPYGGEIHYRCSFDLTKVGEENVDWADIVKTVRSWVSRRCGRQGGLGGRWFFASGQWQSRFQPRFRVGTAACPGQGTDSTPQYGAIHYEHPDDEVTVRQWQTDIGLTSIEPDHYRFVLTTTHNLSLPYYIGDEPPTPVPSAPAIVTLLLQSHQWQARVGGDILTTTAVPLEVGSGQDFVDRLQVPDRVPMILVTLDYTTKRPKIDAEKLSRVLAGTALVYVATSSEIDKELECLLPRPFRCWNGMVRVYQQAVQLTQQSDGQRHRFFTGDQIDERTPEKV